MAKVDKGTMDQLIQHGVVPEPTLPQLDKMGQAAAKHGVKVTVSWSPVDGEVLISANAANDGRSFMEQGEDSQVVAAIAIARCLGETVPLQGQMTWEVGKDGVKLDPPPPPTWQGSRHNADPEEVDFDDPDDPINDGFVSLSELRQAEGETTDAADDGEDDGEPEDPDADAEAIHRIRMANVVRGDEAEAELEPAGAPAKKKR